MQRKEFVSKIAEKTDMKLKDVNAVLDGFIEVMTEAFEDDERVELRGFGNFIAKTRKARNTSPHNGSYKCPLGRRTA